MDNHRISLLHQLIQDAQQNPNILKMQTGRRFIPKYRSVLPVSRLASSADSLMRWLSPPDKVVQGCPSVR